MRRSPRLICGLISVSLALPGAATGQAGSAGKAALPAVPYWWTVDAARGIEAVPLLWLNDVDGGKGGDGDGSCCVIGLAARHRLGSTTLWWGLGFGLEADGGTPAAIEAIATHVNGGSISFRKLHGRNGFSVQYPVLPDDISARVSVGVSSVWLDDTRYLETVTLFECPAAPAAPCNQVETPYTWSAGRDNALVLDASWGRGEPSAPQVKGNLAVGVGAVGGDHEYVRGEVESRMGGRAGRLEWSARLAGGWSSGGSPRQRRFLLEGADPITRWLNPYLDARGALFSDVPYFVEGGPHLRAYEETRPLVKRYLAAAGEVGRTGETRGGFWGRAAGFLEAAWTPGIPDRLGPEQLSPGGSLLFDWRELPRGEGEELGRFRARSLEVSEIWADAGLALTGGHERVSVTLSFPLWASAPAFASEPIGGGEKKAFAIRWALSIALYPQGRPRE